MTQTTLAWRLPLAIVLISGCAIAAISFGARAGFGLYLGDISKDFFDNKTAVLSLSLAIQNLFWGAASPVAGLIADKWGSGRVLAAGAILYAGGMAAVPFADTPLMMHLTAGVMVGLGTAFASFGVVLSTFSRKVTPERRAFAIGIATAFGSVGQLTLIPMANQLMIAYDWQVAIWAMAGMVLLIVPLSMAVTGRGEAEPGITFGFFVCGFHVAFIQVHLPKYLEGHAMPAWLGGVALALIGGFNIIGTVLIAWLSNRISKRITLSFIYLSRTIAIVTFVLVPISENSVLVFASVMGLFWLSTVPPTSGLIAQFFGLRYMASLFGVVFLGHQVGSFIGVYMAGVLFDTTGSYDIVWWLAAALSLLATLVHIPIKEAPVARMQGAAA
jgi:MFS family permease